LHFAGGDLLLSIQFFGCFEQLLLKGGDLNFPNDVAELWLFNYESVVVFDFTDLYATIMLRRS
jgi:hypothetical protein